MNLPLERILHGLQITLPICVDREVTSKEADERAAKEDTAWQRSREMSDRNKYGLEMGERIRMFELSGGTCEICGTDMHSEGRSRNSAVIDHCHECGDDENGEPTGNRASVRGLICSSCNNRGVPLRDSLTFIKAYRYLRRHEQSCSARSRNYRPKG